LTVEPSGKPAHTGKSHDLRCFGFIDADHGLRRFRRRTGTMMEAFAFVHRCCTATRRPLSARERRTPLRPRSAAARQTGASSTDGPVCEPKDLLGGILLLDAATAPRSRLLSKHRAVDTGAIRIRRQNEAVPAWLQRRGGFAKKHESTNSRGLVAFRPTRPIFPAVRVTV